METYAGLEAHSKRSACMIENATGDAIGRVAERMNAEHHLRLSLVARQLSVLLLVAAGIVLSSAWAGPQIYKGAKLSLVDVKRTKTLSGLYTVKGSAAVEFFVVRVRAEFAPASGVDFIEAKLTDVSGAKYDPFLRVSAFGAGPGSQPSPSVLEVPFVVPEGTDVKTFSIGNVVLDLHPASVSAAPDVSIDDVQSPEVVDDETSFKIVISVRNKSKATWRFGGVVITLSSDEGGVWNPETKYVRRQIVIRPGQRERVSSEMTRNLPYVRKHGARETWSEFLSVALLDEMGEPLAMVMPKRVPIEIRRKR